MEKIPGHVHLLWFGRGIQRQEDAADARHVRNAQAAGITDFKKHPERLGAKAPDHDSNITPCRDGVKWYLSPLREERNS